MAQGDTVRGPSLPAHPNTDCLLLTLAVDSDSYESKVEKREHVMKSPHAPHRVPVLPVYPPVYKGRPLEAHADGVTWDTRLWNHCLYPLES